MLAWSTFLSGRVPDEPGTETRSMHMKRAMITVVTMAILSSALILSGCAALVGGAAAGAGTYVWTQGSMEREYQASLDQTFDSTVQALQEMGMTIEEQDRDMTSGSIEARMGDTTYFINLDRQADERTSVSVRAGLLGDEQASRMVHRSIEENLE
jgi:uncharacterized protein HemX